MMMRKIGTTLTMLLLALSLLAQVVVEKSTEKIRIDGKVYYIHTAKKGETIYSISKAYNVSQDVLKTKNPALSDGLKVGERLMIPLENEAAATTAKPATSTQQQNTTANSGFKKTHVVQKKETLYSISRQYQVDVNELMRVNNLPNNDLKEGMELVIPVPATTVSASNADVTKVHGTVSTEKNTEVVPVQNQSQKQAVVQAQQPRYHKVKSNETMESIAAMYNVSEQALTDLNKDVFRRGRLMTGALLEIPPASATAGQSTNNTPQATLPVVSPVVVDCVPERLRAGDRAYKVALLLPLAATASAPIENVVTDDTGDVAQPLEYSLGNDNYVEFYEGALLALEDMKTYGMNVDLSVFDLQSRKENVAALINRGELRNFDLIMGPIHAQEFMPVAEYAKQYQIKIVSPLDAKTENLVTTNSYVFQVNPSSYYQYRKLFADIDPNKDRNIILVYEEYNFDSLMVATLHSTLETLGSTLQTVTCQAGNRNSVREAIQPLLDRNKDNRVVIASSNEVFVTDVLSLLHQLVVLRKYEVTVYGTSRWRNFESVDLAYFHELNLKMVLPFFIDYTMPQVKDFVLRYRDSFNGEPSQFAFQGYDVFTYFMQALWQYGLRFENCLSNFNQDLLQGKYRFLHADPQAGYWNTESVRVTYTPSYTIERD